jgi:hypothetical protein
MKKKKQNTAIEYAKAEYKVNLFMKGNIYQSKEEC